MKKKDLQERIDYLESRLKLRMDNDCRLERLRKSNQEMYEFFSKRMNELFLSMNTFGSNIADSDNYKIYMKAKSAFFIDLAALVELSLNIYFTEQRQSKK